MSSSSFSPSMNTSDRLHSEQPGDDKEQRDRVEEREPDDTMIPREDSDSSSDDGSTNPDSIMLEEPPRYLLKKPLSYYDILPGKLSEYHPGCSVRESPSCFPFHTATSPEVCLWFSHAVIDEAHDILKQVVRNDATSFDMPRIASCMRRAQRHIYEVSEDDGFAYPYLTFGELEVRRREEDLKRPRLNSGKKSPLREVWNAEDLPAEKGETESSTAVGIHPTLMAAIREFDSGYHSPGDQAQKSADSTDEAGPSETRACDINPTELAHLMALLSGMDDSDSDDEDEDDNDRFPGPF
ncbi:hypothetical protein HDK77DRAFT_500185 [Phyllosticta capitalensis]